MPPSVAPLAITAKAKSALAAKRTTFINRLPPSAAVAGTYRPTANRPPAPGQNDDAFCKSWGKRRLWLGRGRRGLGRGPGPGAGLERSGGLRLDWSDRHRLEGGAESGTQETAPGEKHPEQEADRDRDEPDSDDQPRVLQRRHAGHQARIRAGGGGQGLGLGP